MGEKHHKVFPKKVVSQNLWKLNLREIGKMFPINPNSRPLCYTILTQIEKIYIFCTETLSVHGYIMNGEMNGDVVFSVI